MTTQFETVVKRCLEDSTDTIEPEILARLELARAKALASVKVPKSGSMTDVLVISPYVSVMSVLALLFGLGTVQASQKSSYDSFLRTYSIEQSTCGDDIAAYSDSAMYAMVSAEEKNLDK